MHSISEELAARLKDGPVLGADCKRVVAKPLYGDLWWPFMNPSTTECAMISNCRKRDSPEALRKSGSAAGMGN